MIILFNIPMYALEFGFDDLRKYERLLVLKEFKKLYKERKNIHYNARQVLKHARSKSLSKNNLSFFQAKKFNYEEVHPIEQSNVYLSGEVTCDGDCQAPSQITVTDTAPPMIPGSAVETSTEPSFALEKENTPIRGSIVSPWARR